MLVKCSPTICDAGPTWNKPWMSVSCLLSSYQLNQKLKEITKVDVALPVDDSDCLEEEGGIFERSLSNVGGGKNGGMTGLKVPSSIVVT